jgi:4'-phosphopantetheinyl transferase
MSHGMPGPGGRVAVWEYDLDAAVADITTLSPDEIERANRFSSPLLRDRFIAGRGWLRTVIGQALARDPASLRFRYVGLGKPVLDDPGEGLSFSLSHTGRRALLGVGPPGPLGVDLERVERGAYEREAAGTVLSPDELTWIDAAEDPDRAFIRCWVRKEALAKVDGRGLDRHLATSTLTGPRATPRSDGVRIIDLAVGEGFMAAIAHDPDVEVVHCGRWRRSEAA